VKPGERSEPAAGVKKYENLKILTFNTKQIVHLIRNLSLLKPTFMKRIFWMKQLPLALLALAFIITAASWQTQPGKSTPAKTDTVPDKDKKVKNIDEALEELEKAQAELEKSGKDRDWSKMDKELQEAMKELKLNSQQMKVELEKAMKELDMAKMQADIQKSMKEVDMVKMKSDMEKAMKELDAAKMQGDLEKTMKEVDMEKIKAQMEKALKEVDAAKMQAELQASLSKIDMEKMKTDIEKSMKDIDMKQIEEELKNLKPELEKSMAGARESVEQAKKELTAYKGFIDGLDRDGLIKKNEPYTIEYKNNELTINGKKQPASVVEKYKSFLNDHKDFTIKKDKENFNIDKD